MNSKQPETRNLKRETKHQIPSGIGCLLYGGSWRDRLRTLASIMYFHRPAPFIQRCFFWPFLSQIVMFAVRPGRTLHSTCSIFFRNRRRRYMPEKANPLNSILLAKREARAKKSRFSGSLNRLDSKLSSFDASLVSEDIACKGR